MSKSADYTPAYDTENIFAKILRGEIPNHTIYEDDNTLAFLDVMPASPGHCLVIPKDAAVNLTDISAQSLSHTMSTAQKIAASIVEAMGAEGFLLQQLNGAAAGQTVFHLHFHIIPRWQDTPMKRHGSDMASNELLAEQAQLIKQTLSDNGVIKA